MPTTSNKPLPEQRPPGMRKRTLAPILADPDNVDAAAIKRRKLESLRQQRQPSIEIILDDPDDSPPLNYPPRKTSTILEENSSDDDSMGDAGLFDIGSLGVSDNGNRDDDRESDGDRDGDDEEDRDLDNEDESEDAELGEHSYIFHSITYL